MFPGRVVTADGNEMTFQVNYLAGFLLTGLLLPRLAVTPGSRVLATSSMINLAGRIDLGDLNRARRPYRQFAAYADSKLASILFVRELARRVAGSTAGPAVTAFHPGFVLSQFGRDTWYISRLNGRWWNRFVARTPEHGAEPLTALAVRPDPHTVNGAYLHRFRRRERLVASQARDAGLARELWERSTELAGLPGWP
jgi:NAD(P)-dependent dehydrogenase (short-subunit alcohol dehydrogenase family)